MRLPLLLLGFAAAVGLRVLVGGEGVATSVPAGLVFATVLLALTAAVRPAVRATPRAVAVGLVGVVVLCLPVLTHAAVSHQALRGTHGFWAWLAAVAVVVAAEEVFLRGALFEAVGRPWPAVLLGAACFALLHVPLYGWHVLPLDLAVGVVLGGLRVESGTPVAPLLAHLGADVVGWFVS